MRRANKPQSSITMCHDHLRAAPRRAPPFFFFFKEQILLITKTQSLAGGLIRQLVNERLSMIDPPPPPPATLAPLPPNPEPPPHPPRSFWRLFSRRSPGVLRHSLVLKESDFPFFPLRPIRLSSGSVAGILYECVNGKTFSNITLSGRVHSLSCGPHYGGRKKIKHPLNFHQSKADPKSRRCLLFPAFWHTMPPSLFFLKCP